MKKLVVTVNKTNANSTVEIMKKVNEIPCRLQIDLQKNLITAENVKETEVDQIIDLINSNYTMLIVDIDNRLDNDDTSEDDNTNIICVDQKHFEKINKTIEKKQEELQAGMNEVEENSEIIAIEDEYVIKKIRGLLDTVNWAINEKRVPSQKIGKYIDTWKKEIFYQYSDPNKIIDFSIGDIVGCDYGQHLKGEINGGYIPAIVCHFSSAKMPYLLPINTSPSKISTNFIANVCKDIIFSDYAYAIEDNEVAILLEKGKYMHPRRVKHVIGKVEPEFFQKILKKLATTFDFTNYNVIRNMPDQSQEAIAETIIAKCDDVKETVESINSKASKVEAILLETFPDAFDKVGFIDSFENLEEQIDTFLTDIGMTESKKIIAECFKISFDIHGRKISYDKMACQVNERFPNISFAQAKRMLKKTFDDWMRQYPKLKEECPKLTLSSLLRVFGKRAWETH